MADNIYVSSTGPRSGKTAVCLGVMELMLRKINKVGFFRPIIQEENGVNKDIQLMSTCFNLDPPLDHMYGITAEEATELASHGRREEVFERIVNRYDALKAQCDFVVCEGSDSLSHTSEFDFDVNAEISKLLSSSVLLTASAHGQSVDETVQAVEAACGTLVRKKCRTIATIITRTDLKSAEEILRRLDDNHFIEDQLLYTLPEDDYLNRPTVKEVAGELGARVLWGGDQLNRHVYRFSIAAMQLRNFLPRIEHGSLIITPGDRADVILACLVALSSRSHKNIAGIVLTGALKPPRAIRELIDGFPDICPILSVDENTFPTATRINDIHAGIEAENKRKITRILALFEKHVDTEQLAEKVIKSRTSIKTPQMFELELIQKARMHKQHIVLPEGEDERVLRAAEILLRREVVDLTLLGDRDRIRNKIHQLGLSLGSAGFIDPPRSEYFEEYIRSYYALREHKGITPEYAYDTMTSANEYGTMMVFAGHADGMVSGASHSTAATIRPALQIIRTRPECSTVSSVFFMCLEDRVLVYGDCAINPDPDAEQLAEIAISSAQTALTFGVEPVVAMLSYSTGSSGKGEDVDKVRAATRMAKEKANRVMPGLKLDGPIQYDAAVDSVVASTKLPKSDVAGMATVFVFPDLNTGNNTYKAVQRSSGAVAVGPVLQGLKYPVNDLSRGCTVTDIVNTVAITAIQAQWEKGLLK